MNIYGFLFIPISFLVFLMIAFRHKKSTEVVYTTLDKVSLVLNILMILPYALWSLVIIFVGLIIYPTDSATVFQQIIAVLWSALICAVPVYCAVGLGLSVAYRRQGRTKPGFFIQFVGVLGILFALGLIAITDVMDVSWMNTTLN